MHMYECALYIYIYIYRERERERVRERERERAHKLFKRRLVITSLDLPSNLLHLCPCHNKLLF